MPVAGLGSKDDFERMFEPAKLDSSGDNWGHRWRGSQKLRYRIYLRLLHEVIARSQGWKVLDVGCGQSDFLLRLHKVYPEFEYHGVDISENVIAWNSRKYPFISYKQAALPDLGYPPITFDLICALEVLYYLEKAQQKVALYNIMQTLKPGGLLMVSGPLDGGKHYFAEGEILEAIGELLTIDRVEYNYARLYTYFEIPMLRILTLLRRINELLSMSHQDSERWAARKHGWVIRVVGLARRRGVREAISLGANTLIWLLKKVLGWEWLPRFCFELTKVLLRDVGRTHIIILARKQAM